MDISSVLLLGQSTTSSFEREAKTLIRASEENVARIDSQMRDLSRLRDRERGLITALKQVIAPVRKLPAEVLIEIFIHLLSPWFPIRQVLRICQVCAYWRQLGCTTPKLWTALLPIYTKKPTSDAFVAMTKTFLERSAPLPIPISLSKTEGLAPPLVDFVFSLAPRWKSLTLHSCHFSRLSQLPLNALESLETVTLRIHSQIFPDEPKLKAFLGAPRLHIVDLLVNSINHFPMPWIQLTHLTIEENSCQACLDILLQCKNIVTANFRGMHSWIQPPPSAPITVLPWLESFDVAFVESEGDHVMSFFTPLDLPALTKLHVKADLDDSWSAADFGPFQRRSPNIQHFWIGHCSDLSPTDLICILAAAPHLVKLELELCMSCIDDTVLEFLQYSPANTVHPVPRLREIRVEYAGEDFQESILEDMIRSRWWSNAELAALPVPPPVSRWKSIYIYRDSGVALSQTFNSSMVRLEQQGLNLSIA